jgi:c(7)-type cytochrome triheme protein
MFRNLFVMTLLMLVLITGWGGAAVAREYGDITLEMTRESMEKAGVKAAVFPHWFHRIRFKCKVCHENIFIMKKGANNMSMRRIMEGESCGVCHNGQIAWEALFCDRCHMAEFTPVVSEAAQK